MTNIVYLSQDASAKIGSRRANRLEDGSIPEVLHEADDCIARIAGLRNTVSEALNTSRTLLANLDNTIAAMPDPDDRSMLESKLTEAREIVRANCSIIFQALEVLAAAAWTIKVQVHEKIGCKTHQ